MPSSKENRTGSSFSPQLFEKGSFAQRKLDSVRDAGSGETHRVLTMRADDGSE